jgi:hypothetical protein
VSIVKVVTVLAFRVSDMSVMTTDDNCGKNQMDPNFQITVSYSKTYKWLMPSLYSDHIETDAFFIHWMYCGHPVA